MRRNLLQFRPLIAAVAVVTAALVVWAANGPAPARAHGVQVDASPAPNQQLTQPPSFISVTFSEPVEPSVTTIQLWDTSPAEIPLGAPEFPQEDTIRASIRQDLPPGIYTVIWRNLSTVDGHTWAGSYSFIVLGPNGELPQGSVPTELQTLAQAPSSNPSTLDTVARWIVLLGGAVLFGGAAYVAFVALPATRAVSGETREALTKLSTSVLIVTATIAVFFVFQGGLIQLLSQADKLGGLGKTDELLVDTRFGWYLIARQALLLVALAAIALVWFGVTERWLRPALGLLLIASFGVLFTLSMVSHAAGADGAFWKVGADFLHLVTASIWIGTLIHIGLAMPRWLDELRGVPRTLFAAESFRRFSVLAAFSVLVIMVSGVLSALAQFTSFEQLWTTTYGWSLIGKLGAMLPLLAVGGLNAFILQPRIVETGLQLRGASVDDGDSSALESAGRLQRLLAYTVRVEAIFGIALLVAVGVLTQLEPPRAGAEARAATSVSDISSLLEANQSTQRDPDREGFLSSGQAGGLVISLQIKPGYPGINTFELGLGSEFGNVGEVLLVRLDIDHRDPDIPPSRLELPLAGSARFSAQGANLSQPGVYDITAVIRRRGEDDVVTNFTVDVEEPKEGASQGPPGAAGDRGATQDGSIWDWPFEDARSTGAIAALAVGGAGLAIVAFWQARNVRRRA